MRWTAPLVAVLVAACGGPVLRNAPRPDPGTVAAAAAAAAAAATLADPQAAAQKQEQNRPPPPEKRPKPVKTTVPSDVLDRLDQAEQRDAGAAPR